MLHKASATSLTKRKVVVQALAACLNTVNVYILHLLLHHVSVIILKKPNVVP